MENEKLYLNIFKAISETEEDGYVWRLSCQTGRYIAYPLSQT